MASALQQLEDGIDEYHVSEDERRLNEKIRTDRERQKQVLNLKRQRVLSQTQSQPGRHAALEAALAQIDAQIAKLG
jgi:hypothetical protein